jgi:hypothetical protein
MKRALIRQRDNLHDTIQNYSDYMTIPFKNALIVVFFVFSIGLIYTFYSIDWTDRNNKPVSDMEKNVTIILFTSIFMFGFGIGCFLIYNFIRIKYENNHSKHQDLQETEKKLKELREYERLLSLSKKYKPEDLVEVPTIV